MATRRETHQKRLQLEQSLREQYASGELRIGQPVPPVRQLSQEFGLSNTVVTAVLGELVEDRLFHTVARAGTFVGAPRGNELLTFLLVLGAPSSQAFENHHRQIKTGFEDRIAHMGGAVLSMDEDAAFARFGRGELPPIAGVLDITGEPTRGAFWTEAPDGPRTNRVRYGSETDDVLLQSQLPYDTIAFDDVRGGSDATRHLIAGGHRRIGFFGLHQPAIPSRWHEWSAKREEGWRRAMTEAGMETDGLAYHPSAEGDSPAATQRVREMAARSLVESLLRDEAPTAFVAANDDAAGVLLDTLDTMGVSPHLWPSVVGFDNDQDKRDQLVSSLQLPWMELGRHAADLLWERHHGRLPAEPVRRLLAMRLVPRLTCRRDWSRPNLASVSLVA